MIISQDGQTAARALTFLDRFDRVAKQDRIPHGPSRRVRRRRFLRRDLGDDRPSLPLW